MIKDITLPQLERTEIDVTSIGRPDTDWNYIDAAGHLHRWHADGAPVESYSPTKSYEVPTLKKVVDFTYWCDDCQDEHEESHQECIKCGEHIEPGYRPDSEQQFIGGLQRYSDFEIIVTTVEEAQEWIGYFNSNEKATLNISGANFRLPVRVVGYIDDGSGEYRIKLRLVGPAEKG